MHNGVVVGAVGVGAVGVGDVSRRDAERRLTGQPSSLTKAPPPYQDRSQKPFGPNRPPLRRQALTPHVSPRSFSLPRTCRVPVSRRLRMGCARRENSPQRRRVLPASSGPQSQRSMAGINARVACSSAFRTVPYRALAIAQQPHVASFARHGTAPNTPSSAMLPSMRAMTWLGAITAAKKDARRWRDRGRVGWGRTARNFLLSAVPTFSRGTTGVSLTELRRPKFS